MASVFFSDNDPEIRQSLLPFDSVPGATNSMWNVGRVQKIGGNRFGLKLGGALG